MEVKFTVPGKPKGKGRPRFRRNGQYVSTYTPKDTKEYEDFVLWNWRAQSGIRFERGTPLKVLIRGHFPIPKSTSKKKASELIGAPYPHKCDADNLAKSILDAISGTVFYDDAEICELYVMKDYAIEGSVEVEVSQCEIPAQ